ncbi:hypothetical protein HPB48_018673 [Haemaphysalis longicornis]|uniref:Uncharacterized protein n=1 Tax=Haemaphysalis longicornis TaxID=44386 RepID=A0A9J6GE20_HAELO|nr:hypothetical protein HPB48_018673 [Haemaphysalis longicornis]
MAKKSPPLPPNPKEGGYDYRLDVSQGELALKYNFYVKNGPLGDKGGERFWGAEIIKPSKKLSFERDIRVQEFQKDRSSSEVRKIVLSPDCKERAPDPPLDGPDSSRVLEYKPRQSHPRRKKKSRSIKRKKIKKKKSKKKKRNLSEAERIGNITGAASPPGQSTSAATVESTTAPPALGARKGPPPGQPVSDMAMNTDKTNGSPRLTTKRRGRSKKGQKRKKKRRSGSEHHGATSPPSPNGQAQADTAAAGSPSVSGADSTLPVAAGSWSPEIWTRKKKNKKGKRRKKRRHSLSPSPPTGEGKAEQSRQAQLQQYLLEQADERQRYQRAEEMEKAYEKEQKETLRKVRLEGQATKLEERQLSLQPEHDAKGETSPRLEEKPKANGMGQNAPQSSMSQREQNVLLQHDKKVENEPQIEKKSLADAFKQAQDSEAHLQHQLDEVQLEREELLKCIKENTDTYKQFETEHHQRGIETELQRPSEELRRIGGQWNQSRRLANRVLVRRKTVTTLCAPPKFQRARDAEIASLPSRNTSIGRTVILGDDNHVRHGGIGSGKYAVIQETSVAKAIYPQPERGLAKAPPIVTVLDTSGSQDANFRSGRFLFDTTLKTNRGKSLGAQKTPILEMPPEDVIHPIANGLENRIDTFHMNNREYNKNHRLKQI